MNDEVYKKFEQQVQDAVNEVHALGLTGQKLHEHLRGFATQLRFKWLEQEELSEASVLELFQKHINEHFVTKAEVQEAKAVTLIIKEHVHLYLILHALTMFMKHDLEEMTTLTKKLEEKHLPDDLKKKTVDTLNHVADEWKKDINLWVERINSVWATAKGGTGVALTTFDAMHKEGFFVRYQERKKFKEALKQEHSVEKLEEQLAKAPNAKVFEEKLAAVNKAEGAITHDMDILSKLVLTTWRNIIKMMEKLLGITHKATDDHELPHDDIEKLGTLHKLIVEKLEEKELHGIRVEINQLEAEYTHFKDEITKLQKGK